MFEFIDMLFNYEERAVKRDETTDFTIDTALVTDRSWKYETAVAHKHFNNGCWVILEGTQTKEEDLAVHGKLLNIITAGVVSLTDCYTKEVFVYEEE